MHPKWSVLAGAIITAIAAALQQNGLHSTPTVITGASAGILALAHALAYPPVRRKITKKYSGHPGLGLWVWNATDPVGQTAKAHAHGYGWLVIKAHDGNISYNQAGLIREYARYCSKAGIKFGLWGFIHSGTDAQKAAELCKLYGAHFYIADVEVAIDTSGFLQVFRQHLGSYPLSSRWLSSFGRVDLHPEIDWRTWSEAGWDFMPQAYSCESVELSPAACLRHAEDFWDRRRIQPTLGAYTGARGRLTADQLAGQCKGLGLTGVNVWEASTVTPVDLDRIAKVL